jgi:sigma-E factor negative regulatory protein RseA
MQSQGSSRGEHVSAFVDGEGLDAPASLDQWLAGFDHEDRSAWSAYHLIGDALRSDDLAIHPAKSETFLAGVAARLEAEPHILVPAQVPARRGASAVLKRRVAPALAVAAACAMLSWIVVPQWHGFGSTVTVQSAATSAGGDGVQSVAMTSAPGAPEGNIIRDAQLDQYLEAHQQFAQQPMAVASMPLIRAAAQTSQGR